jgi:FMN phosphatase YigB (HAD superfamily)
MCGSANLCAAVSASAGSHDDIARSGMALSPYVHGVTTYRAVLFDWMLTLAHYPTDAEFCRAALEALERPVEQAVIDAHVTAIEQARTAPSIAQQLSFEDVSSDMHRSVNMDVFKVAGFDIDLAESLYGLLGRVDMHPLYPDAAATLASIRRSGIQIAVISDIHVDLRQHAAAFGISEDVNHWALSFELGVQKPDPLMFTSAIDALGVSPSEALMVGDRVSRDGAAARLGIDTLILPTTWKYETRGLDRVARFVS